MELDLLRTFIAVARGVGMRRAAAALHLTQPAVSARIRLLESELGRPLFERHGRSLRPTEAGRLLEVEARAVLAAEEQMRRRLDELGKLERGTLRLATIDAASIYVLPEVYLEYRTAYPGVELTVQVVDSRHVLAAVLELEADVGVLALPAAHPEIETAALYLDRMVCVASPGHTLAARPSLSLAALAAQPLVLYGRGSTTRATLDAVFQSRGLSPNVAMETASPEAMKRLAEVGVGIAIVPEALVHDEIAAGRLRRLVVRDARFSRTLATAVRRGRTLPLAAQRFLELLHRRRRFPGRRARTENSAGPAAPGRPRRAGARGAAKRSSAPPSRGTAT